jgi:hypothetical protein
MEHWHAATLLLEAARPSPKYGGWIFTAEKILREAHQFGTDFAATAHERLTNLLREVLGSPVHAAAFSPTWRTDTVVSLARQIYESHDFAAMPILADALQDAGCANKAILDHCLGPGTHFRGCWVVDLVFAKV